MPRKKRHEDHINHEAWAIPYGDLVTLLLAFFVVMYAISSVNEGKYRVLSDSLFAAFRGAPRTMEPVQVGEKQVGSGADVKTSLVEQSMLEGQPRSMLAPVPVKTGMPDPKAAEAALINARQSARAKALQQVADQVAKAMDDLVKANLVIVRRTDFWIEVEIKTDILFPSASAQLEPNAVGVIEKLGEALAPFPNPIRVEGHTDNRPIKTVAFISNWELSAARAGSVVRVLASKGVEPGRLAVIGYGENRPTHANDTVEGRNSNRRVVVVILSTDTTTPSPSQQLQQQDGTASALPPATEGSAGPTGMMPGSAAPATPAQQVTTTSITAPQTAPVGALATPVTGAAGNITAASAAAQ
ncbi:MAG: flagellar motor protein MotD [Gammaproteobacteria bacterium]